MSNIGSLSTALLPYEYEQGLWLINFNNDPRVFIYVYFLYPCHLPYDLLLLLSRGRVFLYCILNLVLHCNLHGTKEWSRGDVCQFQA